MRWILGVVDERRAGVHRHEVVDELQVAGLELHAKSDAWSLRQRVEYRKQETSSAVSLGTSGKRMADIARPVLTVAESAPPK